MAQQDPITSPAAVRGWRWLILQVNASKPNAAPLWKDGTKIGTRAMTEHPETHGRVGRRFTLARVMVYFVVTDLFLGRIDRIKGGWRIKIAGDWL